MGIQNHQRDRAAFGRTWCKAIAGLAIVFAFASPATAEEGDTSTLLVVLTSPAKYIGNPAVCPGSSPEENQADIICMAELYEANAKVLRNVGGTPTAKRLKIRFTAHSLRSVWKKDARFLLVVSPFEDKGTTGHFATMWKWENPDQKFCVDQNEAASWADAPLGRLFAQGRKKVARKDDDEWTQGTAITCVRGEERLGG